MNMEFCNAQLKIHGPGKLDTDYKQIDVQYFTDYRKKSGKFSHLPDLPKNKIGDHSSQLLSKWIVSWDPAQSYVGLRHKILIMYLKLAILLR